jgi:predicted AAA+ superfamily ATPase
VLAPREPARWALALTRKTPIECPILFDATELLKKKSFFLFGPRSVGKTTLLHQQLPELKRIDLLDPEELALYAARPKRLLEIDPGPGRTIIIDEIQKVPALLDVVQLAIQKNHARFILTGSSARKLKRQGVNLLGGRAWQSHLHPLSFVEIPRFNLFQYLSRGGLPAIYLSESWREELDAYLSLYLKEEVIQEALTRDVPGFSRFLETIGLGSGEELVVEAIASDSGVKASTVRNYIDILLDTLLAFQAQPFTQTKKRKAISRSKLWIFDVGVANALAGRSITTEGSDAFSRAFEHFIIREAQTFLSYSRSKLDLCYWRTHDRKEVDLVLPGVIACEIKATSRVSERHLGGLEALREEKLLPRLAVICMEKERRKVNGIEILPWREFLEDLWASKITSGTK